MRISSTVENIPLNRALESQDDFKAIIIYSTKYRISDWSMMNA